jgi:hypothetical protein
LQGLLLMALLYRECRDESATTYLNGGGGAQSPVTSQPLR